MWDLLQLSTPAEHKLHLLLVGKSKKWTSIIEDRMTNSFHEIIPLVLLKFYGKARRKWSLCVCPLSNRSTRNASICIPYSPNMEITCGARLGEWESGEQTTWTKEAACVTRGCLFTGLFKDEFTFSGFISDCLRQEYVLFLQFKYFHFDILRPQQVTMFALLGLPFNSSASMT